MFHSYRDQYLVIIALIDFVDYKSPSDENFFSTMVGGMLKLTYSFNALFFFILISQATSVDVSPFLINRVETVRLQETPLEHSKLHDDLDVLIQSERSSNSADDEAIMISPSYPRRIRKKFSAPTRSSSNHPSSTGIQKRKYRGSQTMQNVLDNRLKRFRMLDFDEFQEMLSSFGQHMPNEQQKPLNSIDSIGGMQLANYWTQK